MNGTEELRKKLEGQLGIEKLEARKKELGKDSGGLLSEEALLAIIADEEGLTEARLTKLGELRPGDPVFTRCRLDRVEPAREFRTRDKVGRVRKLAVSDASGSVSVTLWDEETGLVEQLGLKEGTWLRILSATLKDTKYGREVHIGRTGFITVEGEPVALKREAGKAPSEPAMSESDEKPVAADIKHLPEAGRRVNVTGVMLSLKASGRGRARQTEARFFDGTGECDVVFRGASQARAAEMSVGTEAELAGAMVFERDGKKALLCDDRTDIRAH